MNIKRFAGNLALVITMLLLGVVSGKASTINVLPGGSIQTAINAASAGDTIQVAPGIYIENIVIDKRIILQGAGPASTIITSASPSVSVVTITAGGADASNRLILKDLRITGATFGDNSTGSGIYYASGPIGFTTFDTIVVDNNSGNGISIESQNPLVDIVIQNSNLLRNGNAGLRTAAVSPSIDGLKILNSHLDFNGAGLTVYSQAVTNWEIRNSTFNDNNGPIGIPYTGGYGIAFDGIDNLNNITIACSEFSRNKGNAGGNDISSGLYLIQQAKTTTDVSYSNVNITNSIFDSNALTGILLQSADEADPPTGFHTFMDGINITCNTIKNSGDTGILVSFFGTPTNISIHHNNIFSNVYAGVWNQNASTIDAISNWWGDSSGPGGDGPGTGDAVYGAVLFNPFLTSPSACASTCGPAIKIVKKTNGTNNDAAPGPTLIVGSTVNWTYEVTNTGSVQLTNVIVTDDQGVLVTCPGTTLAVGGSMTCTASGSAVEGQYTNVGSVTGTPPTGSNVTATNVDHYFGQRASISIVKLTNGTNNDAGTGPYVAVGSTVTWTYNVTNTGNVPLTGVVVTDDKVGSICTIGTLAPGATTSCTKTGTATAGQYTNIGTVSGTPPAGPNVTASNVDHYFGQAASITIVKKTNGTNNDAAPGPTLIVGSTVTWTYIVTNTGNVPLTNVAVTDNKVGAIACPPPAPTLAVGASVTCTKTGTAVAGQYTNIGTATGKPPVGVNVTASNPDNYFGQAPCPAAGTLNFTGNTLTSGTAGNIRNFSVGSINVHASAFSRIRSGGTWNTAYLGSYSGGLGVTDTSEGNGSNNTHKIDNIGGRDNYVLLEFSQPVVIDRAFLDVVGADSDVSVWIGTKTNPYTTHLTLSDVVLSGFYKEENSTAEVTPGSRWADLNVTQKSGNVVVIAALTSDTTPEDEFKLSKLELGCPPPPVCAPGTFAFYGNMSTSGTPGNIRTFAVNGVTVKVSAFSRADSGGAWATSYLGLYTGGLGVTDTSEGNGSNNTHKVDNLGGRNNYVLFEFSAPVVVDRAYLDIIGADSDISAWIGTKPDPINNHLTLNDALLSSLGAREDNTTTSTLPRWANINAGNVAGNVFVLSALVGDTAYNDAFKISKLEITCK